MTNLEGLRTKIKFGFKGKNQLPLFMIWKEYVYEYYYDGKLEHSEIEHAKVLFDSSDWIGI